MNKEWNLDIFNPLFTAVIDDNPGVPDYVETICGAPIDTSNRERYPMPDRILDTDYAGFGTFPDLDDEGVPGELQPTKGYQLQVVYRQKGGKITFSPLLLEDDIWNVCPILVGKLRDSDVKTKNYQLTGNILVRAMDSTNTRYLGRDAKPMIAVDHPTAQGGGPVRANTHTDSAGAYVSKPIGYETLFELVVKRSRHTDYLGDPEPLHKPGMKYRIACQAEDLATYYQILSTNAIYERSNNYAAPNILKVAGMFDPEPINDLYFNAVGSDTVIRPYFMLDGDTSGIKLYMRRAYKQRNYLQDGNDSMVHRATTRYEFAVTTHKHISGGGF